MSRLPNVLIGPAFAVAALAVTPAANADEAHPPTITQQQPATRSQARDAGINRYNEMIYRAERQVGLTIVLGGLLVGIACGAKELTRQYNLPDPAVVYPPDDLSGEELHRLALQEFPTYRRVYGSRYNQENQ